MTAAAKHPEVLEAVVVEKPKPLECRSCGAPLAESEAKRVPITQTVLCQSCAGLGASALFKAFDLGKTLLKKRGIP